MSKFTDFIKLMTGHFDNKEQFDKMQAEGKTYPYVKHINTVCNEKTSMVHVLYKKVITKQMEKATHHHIFSIFQKIMKELCFLLTIFRMEKIRIHFLMIL